MVETMDETFDMSNVAQRVTGVTSRNNQVCDYISAWLYPDMLRMDLFFARSKSLVFMDALNESVFFFSKSVSYLGTLREFRNNVPHKQKFFKSISLKKLHDSNG